MRPQLNARRQRHRFQPDRYRSFAYPLFPAEDRPALLAAEEHRATAEEAPPRALSPIGEGELEV